MRTGTGSAAEPGPRSSHFSVTPVWSTLGSFESYFRSPVFFPAPAFFPAADLVSDLDKSPATLVESLERARPFRLFCFAILGGWLATLPPSSRSARSETLDILGGTVLSSSTALSRDGTIVKNSMSPDTSKIVRTGSLKQHRTRPPPMPASLLTIMTSTRIPELVSWLISEKSIAIRSTPSSNSCKARFSNAIALRVSKLPLGLSTRISPTFFSLISIWPTRWFQAVTPPLISSFAFKKHRSRCQVS